MSTKINKLDQPRASFNPHGAHSTAPKSVVDDSKTKKEKKKQKEEKRTCPLVIVPETKICDCG
jgi:hypothetical protein